MLNDSFSYKRLLLLFGLIWVLWSALHGLALYYLGWELNVATGDSVVSNLLLFAVCFALTNSLRFYNPGKTNWQNLIVLSLTLSLVFLFVDYLILSAAYSELKSYQEFLQKSLPIRFGLSFLMVGWVVVLVWLWRYILGQKETEQRKAYSEKLLREAELSNLRQQLQPHFLFNSLNSISALIVSRPQEARKMIHQLSDFLRGTLKKDEQQKVSLSEEMQQLQLYLEIEKVRFGHRLNTELSNPEELSALELPALILQPVVENAIKFGLYDTTDLVTIKIAVGLENNFLIIRVSNPFDPETAIPRKGTGFGLNSVKRRLFLIYTRHDLLETENRDNIFITTIKIPQ